VRVGFTGHPDPDDDPSYLRGESGDHLVKLEVPLLNGRLRLLSYGTEDEISAAAGESGARVPPRHQLEWGAATLGAEWKAAVRRLDLRVAGWSAGGEAYALWWAPRSRMTMSAGRHDHGLQVTVERLGERGRTTGGLRVERHAANYRVAGSPSDVWSLAGRRTSASLFATHLRPLTRQWRLELGLAAAAGDGATRLLPRAQLTWEPTGRWIVSASFARLRQADQSLRNTESVVGYVFPADLYIGSTAPGVPEARARQLVVAAEFRPAAGLRLLAQAYHRQSEGLLLVASDTEDPFATSTFAVGTGSSRGVAVSAVARGTRFGLVASYGLQHGELRQGGAVYVPSYMTSHRVDAGMIVFPAPTLSVRIGAVGEMGRRATDVTGSLEWESCNLLDRGCELSGRPGADPASPGGRSLPPYLRLDLGVRQHWHLTVGGRDVSVALFGTLTNLLGRSNVLTYLQDPETRSAEPVSMRPRSPLAVGLDWRF
jgi:hypothetical protein